ncbi:MAG TPA: xanthine dehydrogenase family protein molybdopterin-binding subunit [Kofleriaceae bacterium]|jgi:xanthine dehydrogenase YagR molybdenum-binding subunit
MTSIGKALDRVDAKKKVTGTATYASEVSVANIAYATIVTSGEANGKLLAIDRSRAEKAPGVFAVITWENAQKLTGTNTPASGTDRKLQLLQDDKVLYHDMPIAVVVADTHERAQQAARLVEAKYAPGTPPIAKMKDANDVYAPKTAGPTDKADSERGNFVTAYDAAPVKIEQTYTTPIETHNPMEPHATIAVWQGNDHLTLYDSTQGIFGVRKRLAGLFGLDKENVRVINHYVGGGFGCKGTPWSHVALAAMAARAIGRPVKLALTRPNMQSLVGHRPATSQRISLACDKSGKLLAIKHEVTSETSRFDEFSEPSALQTRFLYSCPNVITTHRLARLDIPTPTFTRAPGESSGTYALESAMDELAYAAGIDPLKLRQINHADKDEDKNQAYSSKSLLICYEQAAAKFGWAKRSAKPRSMRDGRWLVGYGMATATYPARQLPASAVAKMKADGSVLVQAGTQDIGTGTYTIMTQIAADSIGVPFEQVTFELGDTVYPETPVSGGSFTASSTGSAVKMAGLALRQQLIDLAIKDTKSPLYDLKADGVEAMDGYLVAKGTPTKRDKISDVFARSSKTELVANAKTDVNAHMLKVSMHSFGATFAEVGVDEDLGIVRLRRFTGAYAAGTILNPKTARSQFYGGIIWGVGMALLEASERDPRNARNMSRDLADYHVPVNADIPDLDVIMVPETDELVNQLGAKGIGEIGITGAAAAVANAVFHATGKRVRDLPIRLDDLVEENKS